MVDGYVNVPRETLQIERIITEWLGLINMSMHYEGKSKAYHAAELTIILPQRTPIQLLGINLPVPVQNNCEFGGEMGKLWLTGGLKWYRMEAVDGGVNE